MTIVNHDNDAIAPTIGIEHADRSQSIINVGKAQRSIFTGKVTLDDSYSIKTIKPTNNATVPLETTRYYHAQGAEKISSQLINFAKSFQQIVSDLVLKYTTRAEDALKISDPSNQQAAMSDITQSVIDEAEGRFGIVLSQADKLKIAKNMAQHVSNQYRTAKVSNVPEWIQAIIVKMLDIKNSVSGIATRITVDPVTSVVTFAIVGKDGVPCTLVQKKDLIKTTVYDATGTKPIRTIEQFLNKDGLVTHTKNTFCDATGTKPIKIVETSYNNDGFIISQKDTFYDATGRKPIRIIEDILDENHKLAAVKDTTIDLKTNIETAVYDKSGATYETISGKEGFYIIRRGTDQSVLFIASFDQKLTFKPLEYFDYEVGSNKAQDIELNAADYINVFKNRPDMDANSIDKITKKLISKFGSDMIASDYIDAFLKTEKYAFFKDSIKQGKLNVMTSDKAYEILGIPSPSDVQTIKNAYRKLLLKFHPDKNSTPEAANKLIEVKAAYEALQGNTVEKENIQQLTIKNIEPKMAAISSMHDAAPTDSQQSQSVTLLGHAMNNLRSLWS